MKSVRRPARDRASGSHWGAFTLNLQTGVHTGDAADNIFSSIEAFAGSNFNDTFFASSSADNLNGGVGTLDTIDYSLFALQRCG
ncbi:MULTISPECIES: hypothetical protein [Rhizobium]|nr:MULTISPECIES: hypothetical protein [Rhizobium]MCS0462770.1 hypothetical protein [Rhizobium favelukesii]UFS80072.1 hypothetical protein LPB79_01875 [Rhizobium sp. T136]